MDPSDAELGRQEMDWPRGSGTPTSDTPRAALNYSVFATIRKFSSMHRGKFCLGKGSHGSKGRKVRKEEKLETTHIWVTFQQKHASEMGVAPAPASQGLPVPTPLEWPDLDLLTFSPQGPTEKS